MLLLATILYIFGTVVTWERQGDRSFVIDYANDRFLKDGQPFRYISGGIHYFRTLEEDWGDRLYKIRKSGCNAIQTYIPWNLHETTQGNFVDLDKISRFIQLAQKHDLLVILRPGPYICAEWEFGGFPYWLQKDKSMKIRTHDQKYLQIVESWMAVLFHTLKPLLYSNGGPVIMVQVENEYGSYGCDHEYMNALATMFVRYLGNDVVYFTTDGAGDGNLKCGALPTLYTTIDFGAGGDPAKTFQIQRKYQPHGPYVNSEYYTGWLDHWGEPHQTRSAESIADSLDKILAVNASVNMYMFEGGTNFGFMNGANQGGTYQPQPTSYDYDAPLTEAGDPTDKYFLIQKVLSKYVEIPEGPPPKPSLKTAYGKILLTQVIDFYKLLETASPVENDSPVSFETLDAPCGYVLYRTAIPTQFQYVNNKLNVTLAKYHDRASFFVDKKLQGILQINSPANSILIDSGTYLDILVENQGRVNYGPYLSDTEKGILNDVLLNGSELLNWKMYRIVGGSSVVVGAPSLFNNAVLTEEYATDSYTLPFIAIFTFDVAEIGDTFLKLDAWSKGFANLNGFNLGRYWTPVGPQKTLYVPSHLLKVNNNHLRIFETDKIPVEVYVEFVNQPILG